MHVPDPEVAINDRRLLFASVVAHPEGGVGVRRRIREQLRNDPGALAAEPAVRGALTAGAVDRAEDTLHRLGWSWTALEDADYPPRLAALADPPLAVFWRGRLPADGVAVVGARHASAYGREVAEHLGREIAGAGVWVISGMAWGVDAAAHRGALAGAGPTAAVWGTGPDVVYPSDHAALAEEIAVAGCLLTEYPPGCGPRAHHFPARNRLVAGLASVVVVVEAAERSGALITARLALEEGREVMAVPGSIFSRLSAGPNGLLRAGAAPALSAADVLEVAGVPPPRAAAAAAPPFLDLFRDESAASVDRLAALSGLPVSRVLEILLELELAGWVVRGDDGRYRRSRMAARPVTGG